MIKKFKDFTNEGLFDRFRREKPNTDNTDLDILIDEEPYDTSQFGQLKFGVYVKDGDDYYYLGDIREFTKSKGPTPYLSYLEIHKIHKKVPTNNLIEPNNEVMGIIQKELDKKNLSSNLMDDDITFREFIKNYLSNL